MEETFYYNNYIHYDLDFLNIGGRWPAQGDDARIEGYRIHREQFELLPEDLVRRVLPEGLLNFTSYKDFAVFSRLLAYPRLMTLKIVDMVLGQPPSISVQAKDELTEIIRDMRAAAHFNDVVRQALIDYSRFGVFLLRVFKDKKGQPKVCAWDPLCWTPVFYPDGTNRIHYNVIGWFYKGTLTLQIHDTEDGSYEERICQTDGSGVIQHISSVKRYNKFSGKCLLYAVTNTPTTTNPLGTSDYEVIEGLLQKAIQRLQAILRVLDEHADPSMTGPHSLLSKTESGEVVFKTSRYYAVGNDEEKPEYLTWEANLDSSFKAFDELCKQIYILSEMGDAFLGSPQGTGNVVSGTAMRFKMVSPLEKARRITNDLTQPIKEIISTMLSMMKVDVDSKDINISWKDSLPKDPREIAELARLESGSISVKPLVHAIMDNYDLDQESAEHYIDEIYQDRLMFESYEKQDRETEDGRSHGPTASIDIRKKGSSMDPASSENRGDDQNNHLN